MLNFWSAKALHSDTSNALSFGKDFKFDILQYADILYENCDGWPQGNGRVTETAAVNGVLTLNLLTNLYSEKMGFNLLPHNATF